MNPALTAYGRILRQHWRRLMWAGLIALLLNGAVVVAEPLYRSDATAIIRAGEGGDDYAQNHSETYAALARGMRVPGRVTVTHPAGTALIRVSVRSSSARQAQTSAGALLGDLGAAVRSGESAPGVPAPRAELVIVEQPGDPVRITPWGARLFQGVGASVLVGISLAAAAAVISEMS